VLCPASGTRYSWQTDPLLTALGGATSTRDELNALNIEVAEALEKRNAVGLSEFYTNDAVFLTNGEPTVIGQDAIRRMFQELPPGDHRISFEAGEILEEGDLVVDVGSIHSQGERIARYVVVYRRQPGGSLRLAVDVPIFGAQNRF